LVAYASLLNAEEATNLNNIEAESARIERIAEKFYLDNDSTLDYNSFIMEWVKSHADDIVYSDKYSFDVEIPDDSYEINSDMFTRKKSGGKTLKDFL
jgi:hypothetical protein